MGEQELKSRTKTFALRVIDGQLLAANLVDSLLQDVNELTAIMVASRRTAATK